MSDFPYPTNKAGFILELQVLGRCPMAVCRSQADGIVLSFKYKTCLHTLPASRSKEYTLEMRWKSVLAADRFR
jgi:hypothetical protein